MKLSIILALFLTSTFMLESSSLSVSTSTDAHLYLHAAARGRFSQFTVPFRKS